MDIENGRLSTYSTCGQGRAYMIEQDEDKTDRRSVVEIVDRIGEPLQTL